MTEREDKFYSIIKDCPEFVGLLLEANAFEIEDGKLVQYDVGMVSRVLFGMSRYNGIGDTANLDEPETYELLQEVGGGEGGGEYCHSVFTIDGKFFYTSYYYYSYNGFEYDYIIGSLKEVKPRTVETVIYE